MRRALSTLLLALLLGVGTALAGSVKPEEKDAWVDRIYAAREGVERARERVERSRTAYSRMRHKRKERGERRQERREERDAAVEALAAAEKDLEKLLERARRAGVPPGWVREAMDGFEASPAAARD
ncbi:MAG: hypothetical protein QNK04_12230 [Myxococcota bacterium]|nr:hypothetical protein [Myxococcota bacterium]